MLKANVTSATMFVAENAEVLRKHYEQILETLSDPVLLYCRRLGSRLQLQM